MPRFTGCDHEAGLVRVRQIIKTAKTAPVSSGEWQIWDNFGATTPIERVVASTRGNAEVAQPVKERNMAVDQMLQHGSVFCAPAPLAHIGAVALDEQSESIVECAPERLAAVRIRSARNVAPGRMVVHQRNQCRHGEWAFLPHGKS